ncbi:hypothetical protein NOK12_25020 [Nocardioides sp. OK12]|uniref:hypothetical protein n=1 Tax=Nocardioides sp. OK12 TaxID=2758661 RepID=UPI0021C388BE|nr:hypothetical protein [Nocardioides sp. OK12]GHJ59984.1 hypothetical protein NOK12_25020 [Nocardioides sp. OK12]
MDPAAVELVLAGITRDVGTHLLLWRGEDLTGNDLDVVVLPGGGAPVARALRAAGLVPAPQDPGRVLWRRLPDLDVVVDVLADHAWPAMYPPLPDVRRRAAPGTLGLLVAAPVDRVLVHAAEAVAGRPWSRCATRVRSVLEASGEAAEVLAAARAVDPALGRIAGLAWSGDPATAEHLGAQEVARALAGSARARRAARTRLVGEPVTRPATPPVARPRMIALSGMDGAGKSTASLALLDHFERLDEAALVHWTRVGADLGLLVHVGRVARRLLRRDRWVSVAVEDPQGGSAEAPSGQASGAAGAAVERRGGLLDGVWVLAVALSSVRAARHAGHLRRSGVHVVCDRWLLDALVDLRLRYGRHRVAEWLLRRGFPRPDVAVLLRVEARAAAVRKPGDQPLVVLEAMARLYDELTPRAGVVVVDAARADTDVLAEVLRAGSA